MKAETRRANAPVASDRNLEHALDELDSVSRRLAVPQEVVDEAVEVCRKALERGLVSAKRVPQISASCLYVACREREVPTTLDEVAAASGVGRKELARCYRMLVTELDVKMPVASPAEYMALVGARAGASAEVQAKALVIISKAEKAGVAAGRYPKGLAASALYIASALEGRRLTQKDAAEAAGVTEATVRKEYQRLWKAL
ncbi:MAG: hypothetical protein ABSF83_14820 [Nitrososphaerales archaeon]|jgi:transcription initiation factor TFIIB